MEIMETVLDKLINPQKSHLNLFSSHTKGYYLMNYGVIFNVSYSFSGRNIISIDIDKRIKKNNNYILVEGELQMVQKKIGEKLIKLVEGDITDMEVEAFIFDITEATKRHAGPEMIVCIIGI